MSFEKTSLFVLEEAGVPSVAKRVYLEPESRGSCKVQSDYPLEQGDTTTVDEMEAVKILGAKFEGTSPPLTHTYLISS